ncbi:unnamed protein product [Vitrella brassicaformis CCMP3155]|uniref:Uncharacterized protein n=1 Tax=Vitrella brassicaformis (strain CCMP3155) TaxID=1169540 RepID=A0A0G4FQM4_VITBC|nr:unnamed protein product [Vitrella brassicaformis CCMP3155]|eukprot:CEM16744.1 unnamed protein product [Vitrella brassicaformis CCMP3155]
MRGACQGWLSGADEGDDGEVLHRNEISLVTEMRRIVTECPPTEAPVPAAADRSGESLSPFDLGSPFSMPFGTPFDTDGPAVIIMS